MKFNKFHILVFDIKRLNITAERVLQPKNLYSDQSLPPSKLMQLYIH
jgi:hypothetical protein